MCGGEASPVVQSSDEANARDRADSWHGHQLATSGIFLRQCLEFVVCCCELLAESLYRDQKPVHVQRKTVLELQGCVANSFWKGGYLARAGGHHLSTRPSTDAVDELSASGNQLLPHSGHVATESSNVGGHVH